jgi:hypothetical protein
MKLTERKIEGLRVEGGRKDRLVFDDAQRGLAVRVTGSGGRTSAVAHPRCPKARGGVRWPALPSGALADTSDRPRSADAAPSGAHLRSRAGR